VKAVRGTFVQLREIKVYVSCQTRWAKQRHHRHATLEHKATLASIEEFLQEACLRTLESVVGHSKHVLR
jgi:hypothetical protein